MGSREEAGRGRVQTAIALTSGPWCAGAEANGGEDAGDGVGVEDRRDRLEDSQAAFGQARISMS